MKAHIARALAAGYPANKLAELPLFVGLNEGRAYGKPDIERLDFTKPIRHSNFYNKQWRAATRAAGVPDSARFYDLRHAGISLHVNRLGKDDALSLPEIQERAGHASKVMTFDRYSHAPKRDTRPHPPRAVGRSHADADRWGGASARRPGRRDWLGLPGVEWIVIVAETADHLLDPLGAQPFRRFAPARPAARTPASHAWRMDVGDLLQDPQRAVPAVESGSGLAAEVGNPALRPPCVSVCSVDLLTYQRLMILRALQLQPRSGMRSAGRTDPIPFRLADSVWQSLV